MTDEQLINRIRQGEDEAYRIIVERHKNYIYTLIFRMVPHPQTAEDLTQDVFLKLYRSLELYRGEAKFTTWLYRLTTNLVTDHLRAQRRKPYEAILDKVKNWFGDRKEEPEAATLRREEQRTMQQLLSELPEKYKLIMYLYHYKQLSYQEISEVTDLPIKTIETRLYRGKTLLKDKWLEVSGHEHHAPGRSRAATISK